MAGKVKITGLEQTQKNLKALIKKQPQVTMRGLIKAAILIRRETDKTPPVIPVDTSNLRHSWFTVTSQGKSKAGSGKFIGSDASKMEQEHSQVTGHYSSEAAKQPKNKPTVIIGFSANYAVFVHEQSGAVNWQRPGAGAKFLESAINRNQQQILAILTKESETLTKGGVK